MEERFSDDILAYLGRISEFTKDKGCAADAKNLFEQYSSLDKVTDSDVTSAVAQNIAWIAQLTKDPACVHRAIECFRLASVISTITKYRKDVANEMATNVGYAIEPAQSKEEVERYIKWVNSGHISRLLAVISEFSGNGGAKIKDDVFSIMGVEDHGLEKFDYYASRMDRKKMSLERRIQFLSILKDIVNMKKHEVLEKVDYFNIESLAKFIEKDLKIKIARRIPSVKYGILLTEDRKKDRNLDFLVKKYIEHGSIRKWLENDRITGSVIGAMEDTGLRSKLFVASGRKIKEARSEGNFSDNWIEMFHTTVCKVVGNNTKKLPPKVSIHGFAPNTIFSIIKADYIRALKGDKEGGKAVLDKIKHMINISYKTCRIPPPLCSLMTEIETLSKSIEHGIPLSHKGARITARIWSRRLPEDLYHSDRLRCCIYLPYGEQGEEIPLFMMDPKTTMLQYCVEGIEEHVSAASLYAGVFNDRPAIFLDTWDGGGLAYIALGVDKTKDFIIDSLKKLGKTINAANVIVFSGAEYARPEEFCNYLRRSGFPEKKVSFTAVDADDAILQKYSSGRKHHYTDAYRWNPMNGMVEAFVIEV